MNIEKTKDENWIEKTIGFEALYNSYNKCKKGVLWKTSVIHYDLNGIEETLKLEKQLKEGTYKPRPPKKFTLTSPKKREAVSISFRDRVYQKSLNNIIYPILTKSLIYDNCACQKGKGTDFARERLHTFMRRYFINHGSNEGYVMQGDILGYYPNMSHQLINRQFKAKLPKEISDRTEVVLVDQYEGDVGFNPRKRNDTNCRNYSYG